MHSYLFEPHEVLRVFQGEAKHNLSRMVEATRLGYDWAQYLQLRGPLQLGSLGE